MMRRVRSKGKSWSEKVPRDEDEEAGFGLVKKGDKASVLEVEKRDESSDLAGESRLDPECKV